MTQEITGDEPAATDGPEESGSPETEEAGDYYGGMRADMQGGMREDMQGGMRDDTQGGMRADMMPGGMRASLLDMPRIESLTKMYAQTKAGSVAGALPPSLSLEAGLHAELEEMFASLQKVGY